MLTVFEVHKLNESGLSKAKGIAEGFEALYTNIILPVAISNDNPGSGARELAIVRTKLEEACFYAKKAMAMQKENQL